MRKQESFCMVGGTGLTSYANNSLFQRSIIQKVRPLLEESIKTTCGGTNEQLAIADLGCSSGPNALVVLQSIINVVVSTSRHLDYEIPKLIVFLNDLPHNDFNSTFKMLSSFYSEVEQDGGVECYINGTPGSFYGRLFPSKLMNFMYSFTSLHWLSQAPKGLTKVMNKGCIYGRKGSPDDVLKAYREQFSDDFTMFLRCRAKEIVHGGHILLSIVSTKDDEACPILEFTSIALYKLASQGMIDKEKLDMFNVQYYRPTIGQVKRLIESEGSFIHDKLQSYTLSWVEIMRSEQEKNVTHKSDVYQLNNDIALSIAKSFRAVTGSFLASEFGDEITDAVFHLVQGMIINNISNGQDINHTILAVVLTRKG